MPSVATQMQLETIILSEVSQKEKDKYRMISLNVWSLKYDTNEPIQETETQSETECHRESRFVVAKKKECRGGMDWEFGVQQIQTITYRMHKQQGPTVQHRVLYSISWDKQ